MSETCPMKMHGAVTVNAKGQVVIPKEVRDLLQILEGDSLMVITKADVAIGLIKADDVPRFMQYMKDEMQSSHL